MLIHNIIFCIYLPFHSAAWALSCRVFKRHAGEKHFSIFEQTQANKDDKILPAWRAYVSILRNPFRQWTTTVAFTVMHQMHGVVSLLASYVRTYSAVCVRRMCCLFRWGRNVARTLVARIASLTRWFSCAAFDAIYIWVQSTSARITEQFNTRPFGLFYVFRWTRLHQKWHRRSYGCPPHRLVVKRRTWTMEDWKSVAVVYLRAWIWMFWPRTMDCWSWVKWFWALAARRCSSVSAFRTPKILAKHSTAVWPPSPPVCSPQRCCSFATSFRYARSIWCDNRCL